MRVYEVLFIVAPNVEEGDIEGLVTQFSDIATNQGAQVTKVDRMGRRRLAYAIGKFNEGHYVVLTIEGTGSEIAEIERRMRVSDAVIRYITIRRGSEARREVWRSTGRAGRCRPRKKSWPQVRTGSSDRQRRRQR